MSLFTKRQAVTITNGSGGALTNYAVKVAVTYDSDMQADFGDLRFASASTLSYYDYWIESKTDETSAVVWVKIPSLPTGDTVIYMYYGNAGCKSLSSGHRTFPFFEDDFTSLPRINYLGQPTLLTLATPDASGQAVHPDVVYVAGGFAGHRYWLAATPYTASNSDLENPCIWYSDDGLTWSVPTGLTNPIVPKPTSGYNADPALVYDEQANQLRVYWMRRNNTPTPDEVTICMCKSSDGVVWTDPAGNAISGLTSEEINTNCAVIAATPVSGPWDYSPCVRKITTDSWGMWSVYGTGDSNTAVLYYRASTDGVTWGDPTTCTRDVTEYPANGDLLWHIGVTWCESISKYLMFVSAMSGDYPVAVLHSTDGTAWTKLTFDQFRRGLDAAEVGALLYTTRAVEVDGELLIYVTQWEATGATRWRISCLTGVTAQQVYDYGYGTMADSGANVVEFHQHQSHEGGSVAAADGVVTMQPYELAATDGFTLLRAGAAKATSNVALRTRLFPEANGHTQVGFGAGPLKIAMGTAGYYMPYLGSGYSCRSNSGNWYIARMNAATSFGITAMANASGGTFADAFHVWELQYFASGKLEAFLDDESIVANDSATGDTYVATEKRPFISQGVYSNNANSCQVDWVLLRHCADTEPTSACGEEAAGTWTVLSDSERQRRRLLLLN